MNAESNSMSTTGDEEALSLTDEETTEADEETMSWNDVYHNGGNGKHGEIFFDKSLDENNSKSNSNIHENEVSKEAKQDERLRKAILQFLQSQQGRSDLKNTIRSLDVPLGTSTGNYDLNSSTIPTNPATNIAKEDSRKYPRDSYSFIALNGPSKDCWPLKKMLFFLFGLMPFFFQMAFLGLMICAVDDIGITLDSDPNPGLHRRTAQITSLLAYLVFPNSTLKDSIKGIQLFPWGCGKENGDPIWRIRTSCILRSIQGNCAILTAFFLVMTSDNVYDIILNFTAVNFISDLDENAFSLAEYGIFGPSLENEARRIRGTNLPARVYRESRRIWYLIVLVYAAVVLFGLMIAVAVVPENGLKWIKLTMRMQYAVPFCSLLGSIAYTSFRRCMTDVYAKCWKSRGSDTDTETETETKPNELCDSPNETEKNSVQFL